MPARPSISDSKSTPTEYKLRSYRNLKLDNTSFLHSTSDIEKAAESKRCVDIEGRKVIFSKVKNETQRTGSSKDDLFNIEWSNRNVKSHGSCLERKARRFLMKFDIAALSVLYLIAFVAMNALFAVFWYIDEGRCCNDAEMTFYQVFDFAVQTSSTIGYGSYWPKGKLNNFLVVLLSTLSILLSTVYAGLLFFKFITPEANIEFSQIISLSNVMEKPCLEIRVGNEDLNSNKLINAEASLCIVSEQEYSCQDENKVRRISLSEDLKLSVSTQHIMYGVWTLRHFIDENSPLYGFRFDEFPGNTIQQFQLNIKAIQSLTKGEVYAQKTYHVTDVLVGHRFEDQASWEKSVGQGEFDYSKMSSTRPSFVWYPQKSDNLKCDDDDDGDDAVVST